MGKDREIAKLAIAMKKLQWGVRGLTAEQMIRAFNLKLSRQVVNTERLAFLKTNRAEREIADHDPEQIGAQIELERISRIVTKSYAHLGDGEQIGSEEALQRVYRLLKAYDPAIITRNERRVMPKE